MRWLLALLLLVPSAVGQVTLPSVSGYALDRTKVSLPGDFASPLNLVVLLFQRDQEPQVDTWAQAVRDVAGVQIWLMPVSARENGVYRWWLNASYRSNLPAAQPRHYVLPVYVNKQQFLSTLQIGSEHDVVLLLTDKSGKVVWRTSGPFAAEKKAGLVGFVRGGR